jgi:hypothetical protein
MYGRSSTKIHDLIFDFSNISTRAEAIQVFDWSNIQRKYYPLKLLKFEQNFTGIKYRKSSIKIRH